MDEIKAELQRQRERTHDLAGDVVGLRLEFAEMRAEVKQLIHLSDKYVPIVERLDDDAIERKSEARAAAKEASKIAALVVGTVSILGIVVNVTLAVVAHH